MYVLAAIPDLEHADSAPALPEVGHFLLLFSLFILVRAEQSQAKQNLGQKMRS